MIIKYENGICLSISKEAAIPFLGIRLYEGKLIFQVPGGRPVYVELESAREFCDGLNDIIQKAERERVLWHRAANLLYQASEKDEVNKAADL